MGDLIGPLPLLAYQRIALILHPGAVQGVGGGHTVARRGVVGRVEEIVAEILTLGLSEGIGHRVILGVHDHREVELLGGIVLIVGQFDGITNSRECGEGGRLKVALHRVLFFQRLIPGLHGHRIDAHVQPLRDGEAEGGGIADKGSAGRDAAHLAAVLVQELGGDCCAVRDVLAFDRDGDGLALRRSLVVIREGHFQQLGLFIGGQGMLAQQRGAVPGADTHRLHIHDRPTLVVRAQPEQVAAGCAGHALCHGILLHQFTVQIEIIGLTHRVDNHTVVVPAGGVLGSGTAPIVLIGHGAVCTAPLNKQWIEVSAPIVDTDRELIAPGPLNALGQTDGGLHGKGAVLGQGECGLRHHPGILLPVCGVGLLHPDITALLGHRTSPLLGELEVFGVVCQGLVQQVPTHLRVIRAGGLGVGGQGVLAQEGDQLLSGAHPHGFHIHIAGILAGVADPNQISGGASPAGVCL